MGDVRHHHTAQGLRAIVDVTMVDGSESAQGKYAELKFNMFV